jgi:hypothetical protein
VAEGQVDPIRHTFLVRCSVEDAFRTWTEKFHQWWPLSTHSVSKDDSHSVRLEPRLGGRIVECSREGEAQIWGRVTRWRPPDGFSYDWFLGQDPAEASTVDISFERVDDATTRVSIVHSGWERSGPKAESRRRGNEWGWSRVIPIFQAFVERD